MSMQRTTDHPYLNTERRTFALANNMTVIGQMNTVSGHGYVELSDRGLTVLRFDHRNPLAAASELAITIERALHQPVPQEDDTP